MSRTTGEMASATPRNLSEHETAKWLKILRSDKKSSERVGKNAYTSNIPRPIADYTTKTRYTKLQNGSKYSITQKA